MAPIRSWHCSKCHHEWDGYSPLCERCYEVGWEIPKLKSDNYTWYETLDEMLQGIEERYSVDENNEDEEEK